MAYFKSWDAYNRFKREIEQHRRYFRTPESEAFLRAVTITCRARLRVVQKEFVFWRAQLGNDWRHDDALPYFEEPVAFGRDRMKPNKDRATEGRANAKGIPCLYVSTTKNAAMSEVRPWIGAFISVAQFKAIRDLKIVDCSVAHDQYFNLTLNRNNLTEPISEERFDEIVWAAIDRAFAEPITKTDDNSEYAATQILAELFKNEGYDGLSYKSAFGDDGYSIALFDLDSAKQLNGFLYEAEALTFDFRESGSPYFISCADDK